MLLKVGSMFGDPKYSMETSVKVRKKKSLKTYPLDNAPLKLHSMYHCLYSN